MAVLKSACAFLAVLAAAGLVSADVASDEAQWQSFKVRFGRKYASPAEELTRRGYFLANLATAAVQQAANPLATFGVNELSDRSPAEATPALPAKFLKKMAAKRASQPAGTGRMAKGASFAQQVDWRTAGAVTAVRNQGACSDCWSMAATASIEGQWFLAGHPLVALSEQELTACDTTNGGCAGGLQWDAWQWLLDTKDGWITSEAAYPYASRSGVAPACAWSPSMVNASQITGYQMLPVNDEANMAAWVAANGPLAIGLDGTTLQSYTGGIITSCTSSVMNHAGTIVGFDLTHSTPYWIMKNSWNYTWGEGGYVRIAYGSNQCLLANAPSSAIVAPIPTPTGTPAPGTFTQYVCPDDVCLDGCSPNTLPEAVCLPLGDGTAALATCGSAGLTLDIYGNEACTGTIVMSETQPADTCLDAGGVWIYNVCGPTAFMSALGSPTAATPAGAPHLRTLAH